MGVSGTATLKGTRSAWHPLSPRTCTMVQPRSAAHGFVPLQGQVFDNDGLLSQENTAEPPPEDGAAPSSKKRRREGAEAPKKRYRGEQGGLCQLNLDELYIVRAVSFVMFRPFTDRVPMIDIHIHLSYGSLEPCAYLQASPRPLDAQIFNVSLEECSPPSRGPA